MTLLEAMHVCQKRDRTETMSILVVKVLVFFNLGFVLNMCEKFLDSKSLFSM